MTRDEVIDVLRKHELPLPIPLAEASGLPIIRIQTDEDGSPRTFFLAANSESTYPIYCIHLDIDSRPLTLEHEGFHGGEIGALLRYCAWLDRDGRFALAADAEEALRAALEAEVRADQAAYERTALIGLMAKYPTIVEKWIEGVKSDA